METGLRLPHVPKGSLGPEITACMDCTPYRQLVGSLNYVAHGTHPDIALPTNNLGTCDLRLILGG
ncbi:hypothetical protein BS17DRAFT_820713 [Gyrodon lividus]|nr:hypothetical protein BS17DRAFT_820713 [Gyrodon lividus]